MRNNVLKILAQNAKLRLSKQKYSTLQSKSNYTKEIVQSGVKLIENKVSNSQIIYKELDQNEDKALEVKVLNMLNSDYDCTYPLGLLADETLFSTLTDDEKQRYIINLSEKYKRIKANFQQENFASC